MTKRVPEIRFEGFTDEWEQRKLNELAHFSKGSGYTKNDLTESGSPIILYGRLYTKYQTVIDNVDTFVDIKDKSVISVGGEVIVPSSGESSEDIARGSVVDTAGIILGGDLNIIKPKGEIDPTFLALTISNGQQQRELSKRAQGKSIVHLHNSDLKEVNLVFPNMDEQKQISDFLKTLENTITLHQRKLEQLQSIKDGFLQKLFPKDGEKEPEIRFLGFADDWEQRKLNDVAEFFNEKRIPIESAMRKLGQYPYYGATGIIDYVEEYIFDGEYVLLAEDGANILMRNSPIAYITAGRFWLNNHAHIMKMKVGTNYFLLQLLERENYERFNSGTAQPKLNSKVVKNILFNFPSEEEQVKIGTLFKQLDSAIALHQRELELLKQCKKAFLQKMFV